MRSRPPRAPRPRRDERSPAAWATRKRVGWSCLGDFPFWQGTTVTWELIPAVQGEGVTVLFRHEGWGPDYPEMDYAHVNFTWGQIVGRLKAFCETGKPQPFLG